MINPARAKARRAFAIAFAPVALAAVIVAAIRQSIRSTRCPEGTVALGARCCGEGQSLDGDRCVGAPSRCAPGMDRTVDGCVMPHVRVELAGGRLHMGPGDWEAQGVVTPREIVVGPFALDRCEVNEERYKACVSAGSCAPVALRGEPGRAVAGVTFDEAERFCRFEGGRLPTSDELTFAAAGTKGRRYAWGDTGVVCRRAAYGLVSGPCARGAKGPEITGLFRDGASPEGALDLAGNVAEWASRADGRAEVRGGSFQDTAAASLRTWNARILPPSERPPDAGFRCAYPL